VVLDVLLPRPGKTLAELVPALTPEKLHLALGSLGGGKVQVFLPRFRLRQRLELQPLVQDLGGPVPFSAACDLSAALGPAGRGLPLQSLVHVACLETDEVGSTASAATGGYFVRSGPELFRADRPFLVLLRERQTNTILFLGRVEDPS
jgi:serpin B